MNTLVQTQEPTILPACESKFSKLAIDDLYSLELWRGENESQLAISANNGQVLFSIRLTPEGPVMCLDGNLKINTTGDFELNARSVKIHGSESVQLTTDGDAQIVAKDTLTSVATVQKITATHGNVNIKANDDVQVKGERIKLNC